MLVALCGWGLLEYLQLPHADALEDKNPKVTALMEQRAEDAREQKKSVRRKQTWVPLSSISKWAQHAVLISEDASFYQHNGVDLTELQNALEEALEDGELGRGASTITQQLAKNLWLSTDRSLFRKAKEWVLARRLEEALSKKRIFTLYLNVVEWGQGVYGIEAAAQEHFKVSAMQVTPAQAAVLAAMLPAPRKRGVSSCSPALKKRAHWIVDQFVLTGRMTESDAQAAHQDIERLLKTERC